MDMWNSKEYQEYRKMSMMKIIWMTHVKDATSHHIAIGIRGALLYSVAKNSRLAGKKVGLC